LTPERGVTHHAGRRGVATAASLAVLWASAPACAQELLVAAAASLTESLTEIARLCERRMGVRIGLSFAATSTLARQIEEGAPIDLIVAADRETIDRLQNKGFVAPQDRRDLLSNQLVIVVPEGSGTPLGSPAELLGRQFRRVAIAEPGSVPAGIYAMRYLAAQGLWERLRPKIVPVRDVRAVLVTVAGANADAGFVYRTDVGAGKGVRVGFRVPLDQGPKIVYAAAVVRDARHKAQAAEFLRFLAGGEAAAIFRRHGFIVLN
jgi:molybdate transport system substrate-binding protein